MPSRYTDWDDEIIYSYTVLEQSLQTIADRINWSPNFVRNRLVDNGVPRRGKGAAGGGGPRIDRRKVDFAIRLRTEKQMTVPNIASVMNVSDHAVLTWLKKAGVYKPMNRHRDYCVNGHEMNEGNTYIWNGHRRCRRCKKAQNRRYMKKYREREQSGNKVNA